MGSMMNSVTEDGENITWTQRDWEEKREERPKWCLTTMKMKGKKSWSQYDVRWKSEGGKMKARLTRIRKGSFPVSWERRRHLRKWQSFSWSAQCRWHCRGWPTLGRASELHGFHRRLDQRYALREGEGEGREDSCWVKWWWRRPCFSSIIQPSSQTILTNSTTSSLKWQTSHFEVEIPPSSPKPLLFSSSTFYPFSFSTMARTKQTTRKSTGGKVSL